MITLRNFTETDACELQKNKYRDKTISEVQDMIREMNRKCCNDKYFEMFAVVYQEQRKKKQSILSPLKKIHLLST